MMTATILLVLSLVMIYMEFYLPGGIMGTAGALLAIASVIFFAQTSGSLAATMLFVILAIVGIIVTCKVALKRIQQSGSNQSVYLDTDQEGFRAPKYDDSLIGMQGTAQTVMNPSGFILIDGKRHQAVSRFGYVEKGQEVEVISGQGAHLVVRRVDQKS